MEADLARFYGLDYRDRWRPDTTGLPRLTWRRLAVLIRQLPVDSAIARLDEPPGGLWTLDRQLLADVFRALTGHTHPAQARHERWAARYRLRHDPARQQALAAARARAAARRAAITAGTIT